MGLRELAATDINELNDPNSAELLNDGHILISDEGNDRAIEVDRDHHIIMTFTAKSSVSGVAFSSRLPGGNTLITDSNHSRIVEVNAADDVVWQYFTNTVPHSTKNPQPSRAVRLKNGNTLISDQYNDRVIEVSPTKHIVASFGRINNPGYGIHDTAQGLYAPYDAKVIDDFTGLTKP